MRGRRRVGGGRFCLRTLNLRPSTLNQLLPRTAAHERRCEREAVFVDERTRDSENRRDARLVDVQAACLFARFDSKRDDLHVASFQCRESLRGGRVRRGFDLQFLAAFRRVEVVQDRAARFGDQCEAAVARLLVEFFSCRIATERGDGHDQERGGRDQPGGHHAPQSLARGVAQTEAAEYNSTASAKSKRSN